jgi:hypothetical protein
MDEKETREKFAKFIEDREPNPVKWVDLKYLKEQPPQKAGGYAPVVRKHTVHSTLMFFVALVDEPIPENAKMQKPIIIAERKRIIELLNKAFEGITDGEIKLKDRTNEKDYGKE